MKNKTVKNSKPSVALFSQTTWIEQQLSQASWNQLPSVARKIVESLTQNELRLLPEETRGRLLHHLRSGRITKAGRNAVEKLITAELVEIEFQKRLIIKGKADFVETTKAHLFNIANLQLGSRLLFSLKKSGKSITIVQSDRMSEAPPEDFKAAITKGKILKWRDVRGGEKIIRGTGAGTNTVIKYNPVLTCATKISDRKNHPPEIALAHELIHADDAAYGRLDPDEIDGVRNYERQAVGLHPYESKEFTENKFRSSWHYKLPLRTQY